MGADERTDQKIQYSIVLKTIIKRLDATDRVQKCFIGQNKINKRRKT